MPYTKLEKRREWWGRNRTRCNAARRDRHRSEPDRPRAHARAGYLKKTYGLSREDYARMSYEQGGVCAICKRPPLGTSHVEQRLHVDHDHTTGKIRALLCDTCNHALGHLREDVSLCYAAAAYLVKHGATPKPPKAGKCAPRVDDIGPLFGGQTKEA